MIPLRNEGPGTDRLSLEAMTEDVAASLAATFAKMEPWSCYPVSQQDLRSYLANDEPGAPRYAIASAGLPVGAVGLRMNWLRGPYLQFLALTPEHQKQGIGEIVLAWFEGTAVARGENNIWVAASDFNSGALRFYERHEFRRAALLDGLVRPGFTEILLRKRLE